MQQFDNIAQTSGTSTPGHMNYNPFGDAFVDPENVEKDKNPGDDQAARDAFYAALIKEAKAAGVELGEITNNFVREFTRADILDDTEQSISIPELVKQVANVEGKKMLIVQAEKDEKDEIDVENGYFKVHNLWQVNEYLDLGQWKVIEFHIHGHPLGCSFIGWDQEAWRNLGERIAAQPVENGVIILSACNIANQIENSVAQTLAASSQRTVYGSLGFCSGEANGNVIGGKVSTSQWWWKEQIIDGVKIWFKRTLDKDAANFDPQEGYYRILRPD